jgi:hypothetical protein
MRTCGQAWSWYLFFEILRNRLKKSITERYRKLCSFEDKNHGFRPQRCDKSKCAKYIRQMLCIFEHKLRNEIALLTSLHNSMPKHLLSHTPLFAKSSNWTMWQKELHHDLANCQGCATCCKIRKCAGFTTQYRPASQNVCIDEPSLRKLPKGRFLTFECVWSSFFLILVPSSILDYIQQLRLWEKEIMESQKLKLTGKLWWYFGRGVIYSYSDILFN